MSEDEESQLSEDELDAANGEVLPEREEMSPIPLLDPIGGGGATLPVEPPAES